MNYNAFKKLPLILALAVMVAFTSCKDEEEKLPPIGGFDKSDDIAASSLVAKWSFNGNLNESISNLTPTNSTNSTFVSGISGQAVNLSNGFIYFNNLSDKLSALNSSITLSIWGNVTNTQGAGDNATPLMLLTGGANIVADTGPAEACTAIMIETAHFSPASDTQRVKSLVGVTKQDGSTGSEDNVNWWGLDNITTPGQMVRNSGKMAHYVLTWDNETSKINLFVNGVKATNPEWETKTGAKFKSVNDMKVIFGGFMNNAGITTKQESWAQPMTGILDEARIYSKLLSDTEISSLYQLELAGR